MDEIAQLEPKKPERYHAKGPKCELCGFRELEGIHLPLLKGPNKGKPWGHAFVPKDKPSDGEETRCK